MNRVTSRMKRRHTDGAGSSSYRINRLEQPFLSMVACTKVLYMAELTRSGIVLHCSGQSILEAVAPLLRGRSLVVRRWPEAGNTGMTGM